MERVIESLKELKMLSHEEAITLARRIVIGHEPESIYFNVFHGQVRHAKKEGNKVLVTEGEKIPEDELKTFKSVLEKVTKIGFVDQTQPLIKGALEFRKLRPFWANALKKYYEVKTG